MSTLLKSAAVGILASTFSLPLFAGVSAPAVPVSTMVVQGDRLALVAASHIVVNPGALDVLINRDAIARIGKGQTVSIDIAGAGRFDYIVDQLIIDADVLEISGHLRDQPARTIALGLRADGLTGLIDTGTQIYALGYANKVQYFGEAGPTWMAKELAGEATAIRSILPVPGALPPVAGADAAEVDLAVLSAMQSGDDVVMQLPGLGYTRITLDEIRPGDGATTWVGHLKDFGDSYKAIVTYAPGGTEGTILTPGGEVNITTGADGQQYMFNPTALGLRNVMANSDSCAVLDHQHAHGAVSAELETAAAVPTAGAATPTTAKVATAGGGTIDVLIYYTPGLVTAYGGVAGMTARVDSLIALANQAYVTGKVSHRIRRVGLDLLNIADGSSNSALLDQMTARSGAFSGMNTRRNALGADLVTVIRPLYANAQGSCGVGYVPGVNGGNVSAGSEYGLSVVSDGADKGGLNAYCDNVTLAHELGHNMGLMHDRATVAKQGGGTGAKPYAFGYVPASAKWGTIMSYTFPHQITFSNPLDSTCNGNELCGVTQASVSSADNVAALAYTMPLVAGFRPTAGSTVSFTVSGVVTVDGRAVAGAAIVVGNVTGGNATNVSCTASGSNGVYACTAPAGYGFRLTPSYPVAGGGTVAWTPASASFAALAKNQSANFSGVSPARKYTLSGTIKINGAAAGGVSMKLSGTDAAKVSCSASTSTGAYSCSAPAGANFTVTPATTVPSGSTLSWAPASAAVASMASDKAASFAGTLAAGKRTLTLVTTVNGTKTLGVPIRMTVSGDVRQVSCAAVADVTIKCQIPSNYAITVTPLPTSSTMLFTPASQSVSSLPSDKIMTFVGKTR